MNKEILKSFLLSVRPQLLIFFGLLAVFGMIFVFNRQPMGLFLYGVELSAFLIFIYLIVQFIRYRKRYILIQNLQPANAGTLEELPKSRDSIDSLYVEKLTSLLQEIRELENLHTARQADQLDYFTLWLHQIKTPIAAISLLNQGAPSKEAKQISQELLRLEDYTHMALNYIKLEDSGAELDLTEVELDDVIKRAVKKYSILFIYKGIKLDYQAVGMEALSDGKWLQNLLEQILSNSLKYTASGTISIYQDPRKEGVLVVEDTGSGIRPEDLPKIFNKGYSGFNGRLHEKSTGLGLFLSKKICERLGHRIEIESAPGKGTRVLIDLSRKEIEVFD